MRETKDMVIFSQNDIFSNSYHSVFKIDDKVFNNAEQAIAYYKAKFYKNDEVAEKVLESKTPFNARTLVSNNQLFPNDMLWKAHIGRLMCRILISKFVYNFELQNKLIETEGKAIVYADISDRYFGTGWSYDNIANENEEHWTGGNFLGTVLMYVREVVKRTHLPSVDRALNAIGLRFVERSTIIDTELKEGDIIRCVLPDKDFVHDGLYRVTKAVDTYKDIAEIPPYEIDKLLVHRYDVHDHSEFLSFDDSKKVDTKKWVQTNLNE